MESRRHFASRLTTLVYKMFGGDAAAGVVLILVAAAAMIASNSPLAHSYHALLHTPLPWTPIARLYNLHLWINDALMAVFFFVVGLEIKRELLHGELSSPAKRRLPVLAAGLGMIAPALVYLTIVGGEYPLERGWAIPAATDIAFAMGVVGLLGRRVPPSLRLFLLTVAIVDDLGAVAIIALFYTAKVQLMWLVAAMVVFAGLITLNRPRTERHWPYILLGIALWYCVLHSGIHATIAGVWAALVIPMRIDSHGDSMLLRMEHALVPWNAFLIVPAFGMANAGVSLSGIGLDGLTAPLPLAVALGLIVGKQAGIFGAILIADKIGFAHRPEGATWLHLWGMSVLSGIGFTMSLFIGGLAFPLHPHLVEEAKLGVLTGTLVSALIGYTLLRLAPSRPAEPARADL